MLGSDDDDIIKIASNGGIDGAMMRGSGGGGPRHETEGSPPRSHVDRVALTDWPGRPTASAPLLPAAAADMVVCLGTACRNGVGYQTTTTTTRSSTPAAAAAGTLVSPPSYDDSVCRCVHLGQPASLDNSRTTYYHRHHYPASSQRAADLLTSRAAAAAAAQLNFYTNRT